MNLRSSLIAAATFSLLALTGCDNTPKCGSGTRADGDVCVPASPVTCGAGTKEEGGACVPVSELTCGNGTHAVDGKCVPHTSLECGAGTKLENGQCVSAVTCPAGTHLEGTTCVADTPTTSWSANVRVSDAMVHATDPSIAADADGHVWIAFTEYVGQSLVVNLYASSDSGATWTKVRDFEPSELYTARPNITATEDGKVFVTFTDYRIVGQSYASDILLVRSEDHGATWAAPQKLNVDDGSVYHDQPRLTVAADGSVHAHFLTALGEGDYRTTYLSSDDGGKTWGSAELLPAPPGSAFDYVWSTAYAASAVTSDGTLLIPEIVTAYYAGTRTVGFVHRPTVGGAFQRTVVESVFGIDESSPVVASSATGRNCFAFANAPSRDQGIYVATADGTVEFGQPVRVDEGVGSTQTAPWMAADADGRCHLAWLDNRSGKWEIWGATVREDGSVSGNERISDAAFEEDGSGELSVGDFIGITVGASKRFAAWTDTRDGHSAIYVSSAPVAVP